MSSTRGPKRHSFHYDSDDGLMDEIEKVTAPPGKTFLKVVKEEIVSQKNWKSVNAQYCIVCREGGELLCCDTCPASFHLLCHEPVIHKDDIPAGKWLCNRCEHTPPQLLKPINELDPMETEEQRNRRAALRVMETADPSTDPLSLLAQAALAVNAQQFELPPDYETLNVPFDYIKTRKLDLFNLRCRMCLKIEDNKPLTKCDFCDGAYHLDCVNPPLCSQPKGKWMCPNHVHPIVEHKLLKSSSVFERKKLWEEWATKKLDDITIVRSFLQKTKKIQKKNKDKMPRGIEKGSVKLPVKEMYRRRFDNMEERVQFATEEERRSFISSLAVMHAKIVQKTKVKANRRKRIKKDVKIVMEKLLKRVEEVELTTDGMKEPKIEEISQEGDQEMKEVEEEPAAASTAQPVVKAPVARKLSKREVRKVEEPEEKEVKMDLHHPENLYDDCLDRLQQCQDPTSRLYLSLAAQRLEQLQKQTAIVRKGRCSVDKTYLKRNFIPDYPILAVLKAEGDTPPIAIQRTVSTIGYGNQCTIQLTEAMTNGRICTAQEVNHAAIVFDKIARRFELTPTGCSQVTVDGIFYGGSLLPGPSCLCNPVYQTPVEQSAPLRHGSTIKIGCSRFVFASFY